MFRSKKFIIVASLLACVILFGAVGGTVLAQGRIGWPDGGKDLLARVAKILEIEEQTLTTAFEQARAELKAENPRPEMPRFQNQDELLDQLVQDGKINQEQADQLKAWWAAKPAANPKDDPEAFKTWMESRPDVPMGPGFAGPRQHGRNFIPRLAPTPKPTS